MRRFFTGAREQLDTDTYEKSGPQHAHPLLQYFFHTAGAYTSQSIAESADTRDHDKSCILHLFWFRCPFRSEAGTPQASKNGCGIGGARADDKKWKRHFGTGVAMLVKAAAAYEVGAAVRHAVARDQVEEAQGHSD